VRDYEARFHEPIGPYSANAYAATQVAIAAIAAATKENGGKVPTRAQVLAQIAKTNALSTPIGRLVSTRAGTCSSRSSRSTP